MCRYYIYIHMCIYKASCLQWQNVSKREMAQACEDCVLRWCLCVESHYFCFLFGYSLGPKMVDPILTFVLPISICIKLTVVNGVPGILQCLYPNIADYGLIFLCKQQMLTLHTACSKSPDIPMESSNCSGGISRALQTSILQSTSACFQITHNKN